ncbi:MAG: hypothetical protein WC989_00260 [Micavibrio sp.]
MSDWKARKKLKYSLLRRAFQENRGAEVILLIQWRLAQERHKSAPGAAIAKAFIEEQGSQPRAIRALNLVAAGKGIEERYYAAPVKAKVDILAAVKNQPEEERILLPERPEPRKLYGTPADFGIRPKPGKELWEINWSDAAYEANTALSRGPSFRH